MSLMVHPAPLITKEPAIIRPSIPGSGSNPGAVAKVTLQLQGQNSNHVPEMIQQGVIFAL